MSWNPLPPLLLSAWGRASAALLACLTLAPASVRAEPTASEPAPGLQPLAPVRPPAEPARRKGLDLQGLPILNFNTDEGLGYGAIVQVVDRADGSYEPYRYSVLAQFFQTTRQVASHLLNFDAPRFLETPWRLGLDLAYSRTRFAPYYGVGNTARLSSELSDCADREALKADPDLCPGNPDFRGLRYYTYDHQSLPRVRLNMRRELSDSWRLFMGYRLRIDRLLTRYSAEELGQRGDSKLHEDAAAGVLEPYEGPLASRLSERTSELIAGIQYDTRDTESGPTTGMFHELSARGGAGLLGSQFNYWGATLHARLFHPVVPGYRRLVASWRGLFDVMGGEVPISLLPYYGGLEGKDGHGGVYSARGILLRRYQGPAKLLLNGELRWSPFTLEPWGQQFDFTFAGFVDTGRVWSNLRFSEGGGLKTSVGGGLRFGWNREFVVRMDYGVGITEPSTGFYLDIGHIF
jgi:outer membrane protein assembly factor BamA